MSLLHPLTDLINKTGWEFPLGNSALTEDLAMLDTTIENLARFHT